MNCVKCKKEIHSLDYPAKTDGGKIVPFAWFCEECAMSSGSVPDFLKELFNK